MIMAIKNKTIFRSKKVKILVICAVLLLVAGGTAFALVRHDSSEQPKPVATGDKPEINYRPPTKEEQAAGDQAKQAIVDKEKQQSANQNSSGLTKVTPVISYASADTVTAYVPGVFEEGGICTATFTQGGTIITRTSSGFENASYTQCAPISPELPNTNAWSVSVNYKSATAEGSSKATEIK
jgi:ABC-type Na+ efflux pump permease subunit